VVTDLGAGSGDMLKSVYDANADNLIDDTAIAASIARDSELPTAVSQLTNDSGFITTETDPSVNALGKATLSCTEGQVAKMVAGSWTCAPDDTAAGGGDMLKSVYDANADNLIDDTAIAASIARDSELPTAVSQLTNDSGFITTETDPTAEPALGNPSTDGYVLSSTAAGVRSWIAPGAGSVDLTAPGPIGTVTPDVVHATDIVADSIAINPPASGTTDELALREDPNNGTNSVTLKAPANIVADVIWTLPAADGANGQAMTTDGAGRLAWSDVGPVPAPTLSTDICAAGTWAYDSSYHYVCVVSDIVAAKIDVSFTAATGTITSLTDPIGSNVVVGSIITVSGSTSNNGQYTVSSITDANNIVVAEAVVDEAAGATVTVTKPSWRRTALATW